MASKRQIKKVVKAAQKKPKLFITLLIIFILLGTAFFVVDYYDVYDFGYFGPTKEDDLIITDDFMITFLETGNRNTGDAIYVKAGENDMLIDAGSTKASASTIISYLDQYIKDDKLEYVIATHAHEDHIAGFVGLSTGQGIFERYDVETIIDFPKTNSSSKIYSEYCAERDAEIASGATHYTALECYKEQNGAKKVINLSSNVTIEFLYNYYYENKTTNENNYSVCVLIRHGSRSFLLTGDLEDKGEEYLVEYNQLPEVDVYKAGHHGSYTAGSEELLSVIKPDIVCICCCAGTDEYTKDPLNMFPAQDFISRICKYTDRVYVTTLGTEDGFESMNGNIIITSSQTELAVNCSNNNTILKDTDWFKKNRKWE